jgi:hypothetical protein
MRDSGETPKLRSDRLMIAVAKPNVHGAKRKRGIERIEVPWRKTPSTRCRKILVPETAAAQHVRPIRSENRALLVASIARGRRWLDELVATRKATAEAIAARESCSARKVNMTISLAFLAPDLVKAAIEGRSPARHGRGQTLRAARRVVPPAPHPRPHGTVISYIRTSLRHLGLRFPGNGIRRPETEWPKTRC